MSTPRAVTDRADGPAEPSGIAIIDDHTLFATGLAACLAELGPVRCFGRTADAIAALRDAPAALVLLDFYVPGGHAVETIDTLRRTCGVSRIVVISASLSPADRQASETAGAIAFVPKHIAPETLLDICRAALEGRPLDPVDTTTPVAERLGLTERQLDVLVLMGHGYANREIAELLAITPETVKSHVKAVFQRLGVSNRMQAMSAARDNGLL